MSVKNVTLYSLPYVVGVAGILAVAQQAAPPITSLGVSHTATIGQTIPSQIVNRALKQKSIAHAWREFYPPFGDQDKIDRAKYGTSNRC